MKLRHLIVALLLILSFTTASAIAIMQDTVCNVERGETIQGNLYALCRDLIIDGTVEGNVFAIAVHSELNGSVGSNIYMLSGDLLIDGELGGDLHFAGGLVHVMAASQLDDTQIVSLTLSTQIDSGVTVPNYISSVGYQLIVNGDVGKDIDFWGSALQIGGAVDGSVTATVGNADDVGTASQIETVLLLFPFEASLVDPGLVINDGAQIAGDLSYSAFQEVDTNGVVEGDVTYTSLSNPNSLDDFTSEETRISAFTVYLQNFLREFITLALLGYLGLLILPEGTRAPLTHLAKSPLSGAGVGLLTFIVSFPFFLLVLILSIILTILLAYLPVNGIGLTAGIIFGMFNVGGASLFYFVAIYLSRTIVALAIGRIVLYQLSLIEMRFSWFVSVFAGAAILAALVALPIIGWVVNAIALFLGLGSILKVFQIQIRQFRQRQVNPMDTSFDPVTESVHSSPPSPPVLDDKIQKPPGMDNLPSGFVWWRNDED